MKFTYSKILVLDPPFAIMNTYNNKHFHCKKIYNNNKKPIRYVIFLFSLKVWGQPRLWVNFGSCVYFQRVEFLYS